jgi:hypothetical protein
MSLCSSKKKNVRKQEFETATWYETKDKINNLKKGNQIHFGNIKILNDL